VIGSLCYARAMLRLCARSLVVLACTSLSGIASAQDVATEETTTDAAAEPSEADAFEAGPPADVAPTLPTTPADGPGGELDPSARSGPAYGSRAAVQQSEPMAMRRVGQPDAVDPDLPVSLSFFASIGVVMPSSYDLAIQSHAYGESSPTAAMDGSLTYALTRWLQVGGRIGARGRGWLRRDGDFAMSSGIDALAIVYGHVHLGPVIDLGLTLGGGIGIASLSVHSTTLVGVSPRLHAGLQFGFRLARGFHLFLRGVWDYFPWNDFDRFGSDIDLGGPMVGLGLEVKT